MLFFNLKKLLNKILQNIRRLPNYYNIDGGNSNNPSNANMQSDDSGSIITFLSTDDMTSNKPAEKGHILHFNWNEEGKWAKQLFLPNAPGKKIQFRTQQNGTTWTPWHDVYYDPIEMPEGANLNSYNAPCVRYCQSNDKAKTILNHPETEVNKRAAFFLFVDHGTQPGQKETDTWQYYVQRIIDLNGKTYVRRISKNANGGWDTTAWTNGVSFIENNLTTTVADHILDARQGKILNEKFNNYALKSSLSNYATTSSLNNYLLKSGGTATGNITVDRSGTTESRLTVSNDKGSGYMYINSNGVIGFYKANVGSLISINANDDVYVKGWANPNNTSFTGTCTWNVSPTYKSFRLGKIGNLACVTFACSYEDTGKHLPNGGAIATIAQPAHRPISDVTVPCIILRDITSSNLRLQVAGSCTITKSGVIKQSASSVANGIYFTAFYLCPEP